MVRPRKQLSYIRVCGIDIAHLNIILLHTLSNYTTALGVCCSPDLSVFLTWPYSRQSSVSPAHNEAKPSPLTEGLLCLMEICIQGFWRDAKSTKYFDRKVTKICVATKQSSDDHQQCCIDWCHDYQRADAIGPRAIAERPFDS